MSTVSVVQIPESHEIREVSQRYTKAYEDAETTINFGGFMKVAAVVASIATFIGTLALSDRSAMITMAGVAIAVLMGVLLYLPGVVLCSQGQLLRTITDLAVNSSPFLTNLAKARMMSLAKPTCEVTPISQELSPKAQSR